MKKKVSWKYKNSLQIIKKQITRGRLPKTLNKNIIKLHFAPLTQHIEPGSLGLSRSCLNRDSRLRHSPKVSLDGQENLHSFKKPVSLNLSWFLSLKSLYLDKSQQISKISICLDSLNNLDTNLDASKSWFKSLNFKNLDREKNKSCLDE
jgi:hypothetical protein